MLTIHFTEEKPLYEQIVDHIIQEIATENLASRERLPSRRQLAEHLGVSLNTVIKAYQQLLDEGYIVSRERSGYYVDQLEAEMLRQEKPQSERATIPVPPVPAYRYDFSPFAKRPQVMKRGPFTAEYGGSLAPSPRHWPRAEWRVWPIAGSHCPRPLAIPGLAL